MNPRRGYRSMSERTEQRTRDASVDVDAELGDIMGDEPAGDVSDQSTTSRATEQSSGIRGRVSDRLDSIFSVRLFTIALVATLALSFVAASVVPFVPDNVAGLAGVFGAAFGLGLGISRRHYTEVVIASLFTGALTTLLGQFVLTLVTGVPIIAVGAGASGLAGLAGHYFGRDLRAGLSKDI